MKDLLTFVKTRHKEGQFALFVNLAGEATNYVAAIGILMWLKDQRIDRHEDGLELNPQYTWRQQLPRLLAADSSISRLF